MFYIHITASDRTVTLESFTDEDEFAERCRKLAHEVAAGFVRVFSPYKD